MKQKPPNAPGDSLPPITSRMELVHELRGLARRLDVSNMPETIPNWLYRKIEDIAEPNAGNEFLGMLSPMEHAVISRSDGDLKAQLVRFTQSGALLGLPVALLAGERVILEGETDGQRLEVMGVIQVCRQRTDAVAARWPYEAWIQVDIVRRPPGLCRR